MNVTNRLLDALPHLHQSALLSDGQLIELVSGTVLAESGQTMRYVYFPTASFISLIAPLGGSAGLEVGMVGDEGMLGTGLILGVSVSPLRALVQGAGPAWRIAGDDFVRTLKHSPPLQDVLNRYLYVVLAQLAQTAACTRFHVVEARLARWLLMTQDRAHSEHLHVTQEFLAYMLGVRRVGITKAAMALQLKALIHYHRGEITILDRPGLEAASCPCYQADLASYAQVWVG